MTDLQEQKWIDAARQGDMAAFEQLVRLYEKRVFALTKRMCRNPSDAEEAAQEAFLAAWQGLPFFRGDSSFSTWLYRLSSREGPAALWMTRPSALMSPTLRHPPMTPQNSRNYASKSKRALRPCPPNTGRC